MNALVTDMLEVAALMFLCDHAKACAGIGGSAAMHGDRVAVVHAVAFLAGRGFRIGVDAGGRLLLVTPHSPALNAPGPGGWQ